MNPSHNTEPSVLVQSSNIDLTASTKAFWELLGPIQWAMNYSGSVSLVSGLPAGTRAADIDSLLIRGEREELQMRWIISRCPHRRTENWTRDTQKHRSLDASILEADTVGLISEVLSRVLCEENLRFQLHYGALLTIWSSFCENETTKIMFNIILHINAF